MKNKTYIKYMKNYTALYLTYKDSGYNNFSHFHIRENKINTSNNRFTVIREINTKNSLTKKL